MSIKISLDQEVILGEEAIYISPTLAAKIGINNVVVLQQIHAGLEEPSTIVDGVPWVEKTIAELAAEIPWFSARTLRRTIKRLEDIGLLKSAQLRACEWRQAKSYTICYEILEELLSD